MNPKGLFRVFAPLMGMLGGRNLRDTGDTLQSYLERDFGHPAYPSERSQSAIAWPIASGESSWR